MTASTKRPREGQAECDCSKPKTDSPSNFNEEFPIHDVSSARESAVTAWHGIGALGIFRMRAAMSTHRKCEHGCVGTYGMPIVIVLTNDLSVRSQDWLPPEESIEAALRCNGGRMSYRMVRAKPGWRPAGAQPRSPEFRSLMTRRLRPPFLKEPGKFANCGEGRHGTMVAGHSTTTVAPIFTRL